MSGLTIVTIMAAGLIVRYMESENIIGQMADNILENG